jgi:hypothetical protein
MLLGDTEQRYVDVDPEAAYARAALALLLYLSDPSDPSA